MEELAYQGIDIEFYRFAYTTILSSQFTFYI